MAEDRRTTPSGAGSKTWDHKWGFADTQFVIHSDGAVELTGHRYDLSGYRMYDFLPYVEGVLGVKLDLNDRLPESERKPVTPPKKNESFCRALADAFPKSRYSFDDRERLLHSHGQTTADEVHKVLYSSLDRCVDMVFYCESDEDAEKIVRLADEHSVCLIPYGGGTSVSSALKLPAEDPRMMVSVDVRRMKKIEWIDRENLRACIQAGVLGQEMENALRKEGFTTGHEPDSIELSTLGGWIATNASGMKKNRYGNIEQIVENITMITPRGRIEQLAALPRASLGVQPQTLLFGNEGNFGLITRAVLKIHPLPEVTKYGSLVFPDFRQGVEFLSALARTDFVPASIRLVDNVQFRFGLALKERSEGLKSALDGLKKFYVMKVRHFDPDKMVAATIVMEGSEREVDYQEESLYQLAKRYHGLPAGADAGQRGYMLTYAIAYIRDFLSAYHVIGETFETSVPWSNIHQVCRSVEQRAAEKHKQYGLPGKCYVSYRITQIYHSGVCIYFMYGLYTKGVENPAEVFSRIEHSLREAIIENGGSISHHHGVGKIRKDFVRDMLSPASIELVRDLKKSLDPNNVFGIQNNVFAR